MRRIIKGGVDIRVLITKSVLILSIIVSLIFFSLSVIILPYPALASHDMDLEKDLQKSLEEDKTGQEATGNWSNQSGQTH